MQDYFVMQILKVDKNLTKGQLNQIVSILLNGGLIIYPTDTAYGAGVIATKEDAVSKLLKYKSRPVGKAISIVVNSQKMSSNYVKLNETAKRFYNTFLPGPYTVISKSLGVVDKRLESEKRTLGVRIFDHPIILHILKRLKLPITSTSANVSGKKTPYSINDILDNISLKKANLIDLIIDYGRLPKRPTSVVIDTTVEIPEIIRGEREQIEKISMENRILLERLEIENLNELKNVALSILRYLKDTKTAFGLVFLSGKMGAGKTYLVKEIAKLLKIKQQVISPTFVIERRYDILDSKFKELVHYDLWRLDIKNNFSYDILGSIGFWDSLIKGSLVFVEWPEKIPAFFTKLKKHNVKKLIFVQIDDKKNGKRSFKIFRINL